MVAVGPGEVVDESGRWRKALVGKTFKEVRFVNMQKRLSEPVTGGQARHNGSMLRFRDKVTMYRVTVCIYWFWCVTTIK